MAPAIRASSLSSLRLTINERSYIYWDDYRWGYDSWYDDYYYWARTRSGDADSTKVIEKPKRVA